MLRPKRRTVSNKKQIFTASTHSKIALSSSTQNLKKVSNTKCIIICVIILILFILMFPLTFLPDNANKNEPSLPNISNDNNVEHKGEINEKYIPGIQTIYVSVATLGDHACPLTINDLFKKAKYPQNIKVGIYQQNEGNDPDCLNMLNLCTNNDKITDESLGDITLLCSMRDNIIINRTNIADGAKGPVYGRYMSMKLYDGISDFICMIDSHTLFRQDWDVVTLKMWYSIKPDHKHSVITHYPWGAEHLEKRIKEKNQYSYHICGSIYEGGPNSMVRNANGCFAKNAITPIRVPFFAGGFSFAPSEFWRIVPLDPYLLYIFNGEEFDISTRGFTHGYDFYSPNVDIVGHYYDKGPKRRSPHVNGNKDSHKLRDRSEKRLNYLWGLTNIRYKEDQIQNFENIAELSELDKYGLGNKRTLDQYWKFAGIDPVIKNITVWPESLYAKGGLPYVPY